MTPLTFLLISLASYRLTRLVTTDTITDRWRRWLTRRFPARTIPLFDTNGDTVDGTATMKPRWIVELVNCDWCLGVWISAGVTGGAHWAGLAPSRPACILGWMAAAALSGVVSDVVERLGR